MASRRPPDILRKSHAHTAGKPRDKGKRELEEALDESSDGDADRKAAQKQRDSASKPKPRRRRE